MGCVPSRCLYCPSPGGRSQHHHHGSRIPLLKSVSTPLRKRRARNHLNSHHQHLVALTSTSYGLLRWNSSNNNGNSPSSSPGEPEPEVENEVLKTPIPAVEAKVKNKPHNPSKESSETRFFDSTCLDCTDKVVVQETPQISSVSSSSSSSCVNKLVTFDSTARKSQAPQEIFNVNIWEIMAGIDDDYFLGVPGGPRSLFDGGPTPRSTTGGRRRKTPMLSASRHQTGKRRLYNRSNSLSSIQAARNLDSILAVDGVSPAALEQLLKEIYQHYMSSRGSNPGRRSKGFIFGDKENSAPRFDKSPNISTVRKKKRTSNSPFRSKVLERSVDKGGFSFSFFTSKVDSEESSRTPLSPLALKSCREGNQSPSPLFRREKKPSPDPRNNNSKACCSCSCCSNHKSECQRSGELRSSSRSASGPLFDPELLASIERAFQSVSGPEEWYSGKEDWTTTTTTTSSEYYSSSNEEVPLMMSFKGRSSAAKGNKCSNTTSSNSPNSLRLWDTICSGFTGTAKKISFSKISPLAHQKIGQQDEAAAEDADPNPLVCFPVRCPPGGESQAVLYTTSLRGIRKTFEACHSLQMMLRSLGVCIDERDISMHSEFRLELKRLLDDDADTEPVTVPRLFIRGRYIGGAEQARRLHEEGKLVKMLEGIPREDPFSVCDGCGGLRFIPCLECSGSCKLVICQEHHKSSKGLNRQVSRCPDCNENGLIRCPICC